MGKARTSAYGVAAASALLLALLLVPWAPADAAPCPPPPSPVRDLDIPRFYDDAAGSRVDPRRKQLQEAAVAPLTDFLRHVTSQADASLKASNGTARATTGQCALDWLESWARGGAWLGRMANDQSESQRKWDLAGVALAYVKVRPLASPAQRKTIEPWLDAWAVAARAYFDDPTHKRNNHWYWLGLALAGTALATDSDKHWAAARGIMADAARDIGADGTLPMELAREARALHYHAFAVMPLVILAEIAARAWRGLVWAKRGRAASAGQGHRRRTGRACAVRAAGRQAPGVDGGQRRRRLARALPAPVP